MDFVLVMSVEPGFYGQKFMPDVLSKVERARAWRAQQGASFHIEIDGGINPTTVIRAWDAGADVVVAGSAVLGQTDYAAAIRALKGVS